MSLFDEPVDNPVGIPDHICELYEILAFQVQRAGHQHYSARAILHQIRWHHQIERGDIHFKVNNNYSARLARWFMRKHPHMDGFFEIRNRADHDMYGWRDAESDGEEVST